MKSPFLKATRAKKLLTLNIVLAALYFISLMTLFQRGNIYLYWALIIGEVFHVWQLLTLIQVAWDTKVTHKFSASFKPLIDLYITVAGEPKAVVEKTVRAAISIDYPNYKIFILNDGYVAKKGNWQEMEDLAKKYESQVMCITRTTPGGAKAGNINYALGLTRAPFIAILDCDHVPEKDFLKKLSGYFVDEKVAFAQAPQYYHNNADGYVANAAWQQQTLFFGAICRGKDRLNALFMCGTNMVIRRQALESVGGMSQDSITEDLLTSLLMHSKGWRSVYVPRILARGLAPADLSSYWKQQFRWARGSLEVLLKYNPLWLRGLDWRQRTQYLASVTYYLTGLIVLINASLPLFYFYAGWVPVTATTMSIALIFVPYIFVTLYSLQLVSNFAFSFRAIAFSLSSWPIYASAFLMTLLRIPNRFKVTAKERNNGNYFMLVLLHWLYIAAVIFGIGWAESRDGVTTSLITNASWAFLYIAMFMPFIRASLPDHMAKSLPYTREALPAEELSYD